MASLVLNGSVSGSCTITTPSAAGTTTLTLPATTGNIVTDSATQTLTNKTLTSPTITGALVSSMASSVITSGTSVASTSGTSIDFTSIPSWVKRITVMFTGVSTNGTSVIQIQLGDSGGIETTGYLGNGGFFEHLGSPNVANRTSGFATNSASSAAAVYNGLMIISLFDTNKFVASGNFFRSDFPVFSFGGGSKTLSDTLTQLRITTVNGTDTFDAGSINIMYE